jgi:hypothetical protein
MWKTVWGGWPYWLNFVNFKLKILRFLKNYFRMIKTFLQFCTKFFSLKNLSGHLTQTPCTWVKDFYTFNFKSF